MNLKPVWKSMAQTPFWVRYVDSIENKNRIIGLVYCLMTKQIKTKDKYLIKIYRNIIKYNRFTAYYYFRS